MKTIIKNFTLFFIALLFCQCQGCRRPGWISQASGTTNNLPGIWFTDSDTGTVVGVAGTAVGEGLVSTCDQKKDYFMIRWILRPG